MMKAWWALAILAASLTAKGEPAIVIRPHTQMAQSKAIHLRDVAEFFDVETSVGKVLGSIRLADGLRLGERIEFNGNAISALLRDHKLWTGHQRPLFTIPNRIVIENVGDKISEARVRMELVQRWQSQCGCRIELSEMRMPKIEPWVSGTEWKIRFPVQPARGSFSLAIDLRHKGTQKTVWLSGRAIHHKNSPVARRQINIGERIQPEDYQMSERDVTFARDAIPTEAELVGRRARVGIAANEILFAGQLERERALHRGDQVKLTIGEGVWEVTLTGVAEQDGFIGDTVKIRNAKSNQVVAAVVTGRAEVRAR